MTKSANLSMFATYLISVGFFFGLVSCSSTPSKSTPFRATTPTATTNAEQQQEVEKQLLHTLSESRKLGPANPLLLSTMYSLASFYREHQAFEKAERIYQEALSLKEQVHGPKHPDLALILHQYAALLRDARRVQEASELEHRAHLIQDSHNQHTFSHP